MMVMIVLTSGYALRDNYMIKHACLYGEGELERASITSIWNMPTLSLKYFMSGL